MVWLYTFTNAVRGDSLAFIVEDKAHTLSMELEINNYRILLRKSAAMLADVRL